MIRTGKKAAGRNTLSAVLESEIAMIPSGLLIVGVGGLILGQETKLVSCTRQLAYSVPPLPGEEVASPCAGFNEALSQRLLRVPALDF
jgi:hypothetical protein